MSEQIFTPRSLLQKFNIDRSQPTAGTLLTVTGTYIDKKNKPYINDNCYYDSLQEQDGTCIVLRLHKDKKPHFINGKIYRLTGYLETRLDGKAGRIELRLNVADILDERFPVPDEEVQQKSFLLALRIEKPKRSVAETLNAILKYQRRPRIALIYGENAIVQKDIEQALGKQRDSYYFDHYQVNLSRPAQLISALKEIQNSAEKAHLVSIFRGGGSDTDLEYFDRADLAEAILNCSIPVATAIGHAQNITFADRIADETFITPTALGNNLREVAAKAFAEQSKNKKAAAEKKYYEDIIVKLEEQTEYYNEILKVGESVKSIDNKFSQLTKKLLIFLILWSLVAAITCILVGSIAGIGVTYFSAKYFTPAVTPSPAKEAANAPSPSPTAVAENNNSKKVEQKKSPKK